MTAMSAPGIRRAMRFVTRIVASTPTVTPTVVQLTSAMSRSVASSLPNVPVNSCPTIVSAGLLVDTEHAADLAARDLDADAGQEADQDGARQEVGEEAEADDAGEEQHAPRR